MTATPRGRPGESVLDLLARLVALPTESRTPNVALIETYAEQAEQAGAVAAVIPGPPGRASLHARFGPDRAGGLMLAGHSDVVPAGDGWTTDPYALTEVDGRLAGRGTADMKGFLAAALAVASAADQRRLARPLHLALSYDEEVGCAGVGDLLEVLEGSATCRPDLVVVGEPTGMRVCNAHSGKVAHRLEIRAPAAHSSLACSRPSAVSAAIRLASEIDAVNRSAPSEDTGSVSANVGTIAGGVGVNVLAPSCELSFEVRHHAAVEPEALLAGFDSELQRVDQELGAIGGSVRIKRTASYPALGARRSEALARLEGLAGDGEAGRIEFGCEAGLYAQRLGAPAAILGPGHISDAHRPDEFVAPEQLARCCAVLEAAVESFCAAA